MSLEAIARAWMASPHWGGWRVGMVTTDGSVVTSGGDMPWCGEFGDDAPPSGLPDLSHPGTRAFLLEDVRTAWGDAGMGCYESAEGEWSCHANMLNIDAPTEAEALLAALQAAPEAA